MEITVQVFTGGYKEHKVTYEMIEEKLTHIFKIIPVNKVILGWAVDADLYRKVNGLLHEHGIESYLWLPVFSENGLLRSTTLLVDDQGELVKSYSLKEGENFEFYCPNDPRNIESLKEIYEAYYEEIDFDGVFLDKIRYGSFSNGLSGVFSCFCPACMKKYEKAGLDVSHLKEEMKKVRKHQEGYGQQALKMKSYKDGTYTFEDPVWEAFFMIKADSISDALEDITAYFRGKHKKIGMDTFSPFTAYFAGQDFARLGKMVDFIKPMMYRITHAPAGLPFEYECMQKETTGEQKEKKFDMEFVKSELEVLQKHQVTIFSGMEVNYIKDVAEADTDYITEMLNGLGEQQIQGIVLSWDALSAPDENLKAVGDYISKRGGT